MASNNQNKLTEGVSSGQPNEGGPSSQPNEDDQSGSQPVAKRQKKLTSSVWDHFEREEIKELVDGKEVTIIKAKCKFQNCKRVSNAGSRAGTSHLSNHYKLKHEKKSGQKQLNMKKGDLVAVDYDENTSKRKLALAIIMHEYPFCIVEHEYFVDFVKSLRPSFPIQSRNTYRKEILEMFLEEKKKLYSYLGSLSCRFSGTMDLWTSRQNRSYLCVTVHFINENWVIQKRILNFMHLEGRHTGDNLSEAVLKNLCDWNIDRNLFAFTLDNDSANGVCVKKMIERLNESETLVCNGGLFHVRCATHIINLVVQDGVKRIKSAVDGIREIVLKVKNSPLLFEEFQKRASEQGLDLKKGLSTDVCTRWNSTYMMLRDALYFRDAFKRMHFSNPSRYSNFPTNQEWDEANALCKCLRNFFTATELLSGTSYPTSNLFFKTFCEFKLRIETWCKNENPTIIQMATSMKEKFDKYWNQSNTVLAIASFLDPRYKMVLIEYYYPQLYDNGGRKESEELYKVIKNLHSEYTSKFRNSVDHVDQPGSIRIPIGNSGYVDDDDDDDMENNLVQFMRERSQPTSFKSDLDNYMERRPTSLSENFDILSWWKTEGKEYPILSRIARAVLAIPVSTVASESAFSTGGRIVDPYRSRLDSEIIEALICIQDWIKGNKKGNVLQTLKEDDEYVCEQ